MTNPVQQRRLPRNMAEANDAPQGMIAPMNPFVELDGNLTAVSFRFLFGLYSHLNYVEDEIAKINARLAAAGIP